MKRNRFKKFVDFWLAKTDLLLEKGWGGSIDHVSLGDIRIVIRETRRMDDEHGAFWVGSYTHHYVMEVEKNLTIYFFLTCWKRNLKTGNKTQTIGP